MSKKPEKPKLSDYRPQVRNANKHTPYGLRLLEQSLRQDGFIDGQTAAADGEIISGSARLEVAGDKFADVEPIIVHSDGTRPVIVVRDDIPNADHPRARRLSVAANKIAQVDFDPDFALLKEWAGEDEQIKKLFSDDEWREGTGEEPVTVDAEAQIDRAAELQVKWGTELGQLWQLGNHRLLVGDCTVRENVDKLMQGQTAKLAPVDPPYNVGFDYDGETVDDTKTDKAYEDFSRAWFGECQRVSERQIVTTGRLNIEKWCEWFPSKTIGIWLEKNAIVRGKVTLFACWEPVFFFGEKWKRVRGNDIFEYPLSNQSGVANHPCPKPLKMWNDLIENYSEPGDLIYEAFGGSGTTLIASQNLRRVCRIIEISPAYCAVILERFSTAFPNEKIERL